MEVFNEQNAKQILEDNSLIMVKFSGNWCQPCKFYQNVLDPIKDQYKIFSCDVDESPNIATELNIRSIPTSIFFKDGKEVKRLVGVQGKPMIEQIFQQLSQ